MESRELVIIGSGPAGLAAAIYARRSGLDTLVLEKGLVGGQVNITATIENWPGTRSIGGIDLGRTFRDHATDLGAEIRDTDVSGLDLRGGSKIVRTKKGEIAAEALVVASGASFNKLGCKGEDEFLGRGVSYCAVCDGAFFEGEEIAVVGGGNAALEEALYLTSFATKVTIIHRRNAFRAHRTVIDRVTTNPKIAIAYDSVVEEIAGDEMVSAVAVRNVRTDETSSIPVAGVFIFVGQSPNDAPFQGVFATAAGGWIKTDEYMETSVEGVFAAGDIRDKPLRQVVTAAADGAIAAVSASHYIEQLLHLRKALFEPDEVRALFFSGADAAQAKWIYGVEEKLASNDASLVIVDGHKNHRLSEKLGVSGMFPVVVTLRKGDVVSRVVVSDLGGDSLERVLNGE